MIESQIDGTFTGWSGDTVFPLTNGQFWKQARYAYRYHYLYRPVVSIENNVLTVDGLDDELEVHQVQGFRSRINDTFNGWHGDTVVELTNGQVWQQSAYKYYYSYAYRPEVVVVQDGRWIMSVNGGPSVAVRRVR